MLFSCRELNGRFPVTTWISRKLCNGKVSVSTQMQISE
ncbi:unnamed protein product [Larinioides sclopetarius]|uniref:Uncharacterized protein n=1 Tax=Larinioides sclopetarius TaxID=280406 RepID=A0AAV2A1S2_9ARAC